MKIPAAKRAAKAAGLDLWWTRSIRLWVISALPTAAEPDRDVRTPAKHLSAGTLRGITPELFAERYLKL